MPASLAMLSKSRFLAGLQCPLRLGYPCYNPELAQEKRPGQQAIFAMGRQVGRLATQLFPRGILIDEDPLHYKEAVQSTRTIMSDPNVPAIYEAAFVHDGLRVRVDILRRCKDDLLIRRPFGKKGGNMPKNQDLSEILATMENEKVS
ncbi:MAG: hypothetical protein ABSB32_00495 [Thermodesulfobacteriota bacterium]|jgi:hypothetical protein